MVNNDEEPDTSIVQIVNPLSLLTLHNRRLAYK